MPNSEFSDYQSSPVEFYKFVYGSTFIYQVSADQDMIGPDGVLYKKAQLERDGASSSTEITKNVLKVSTTNDNIITSFFSRGQPDEIVKLTVFRRQIIDDVPTYITFWQGRVSQCSRRAGWADLQCEPISTSIKRLGNRNRYQRLCRFTLYDHNCLVPKNLFQINTTIIAYNHNKVLVNSVGGRPPAWILNGYIITELGAMRMITAVTGNELTLTHQFNSFDLGISCTIQAGCDYTHPTCQDRFNNKRRFGGFASIPTKNPFTDGPVNL